MFVGQTGYKRSKKRGFGARRHISWYNYVLVWIWLETFSGFFDDALLM